MEWVSAARLPPACQKCYPPISMEALKASASAWQLQIPPCSGRAKPAFDVAHAHHPDADAGRARWSREGRAFP